MTCLVTNMADRVINQCYHPFGNELQILNRKCKEVQRKCKGSAKGEG